MPMLNNLELKIKYGSPFCIDHILKAQQKSQSQVNPKRQAHCYKRNIDEKQSDIWGSHTQFISKPGRNIESPDLKKMTYGMDKVQASFFIAIYKNKIYNTSII